MSSENKNDYDHIDFRINILYDAVYSNSPSQYIFNPIIKNGITLQNIKEPEEFDYSHIFDQKLEFINKYNNKLCYKRLSDSSHPCTLSFGRYRGMGNVNDLGRGELYNPAMHYILSELVINEKFKHILLPLIFFDVTLGDLKKKLPEIHDTIINDPTMNQNAIDQSKIQVFGTEHYFKMQSLREYIKENYDTMKLLHWKVIIFQVFYTLYKISERLQKFRHNMLNLDSIRIYLKQEGGSVQYKIGNSVFEVPNVGVEIKMTDFTFSTTSDYIRNKDTRLIQENQYYDMHYFISNIYLYLSREIGEVPENLMRFISDMIPSRFLPNVNDEFDGLNEQEFDTTSSFTIVPAHVLRKNSFFSEFIVSDQSRQIKRQELPTEIDIQKGGISDDDTDDTDDTDDANNTENENDSNENDIVSPIKNAEYNLTELATRESGIDYLSITDDNSDRPRMLAKKLNNKKSYNKKISEQYYNKDMIKGSRKIISGFNSENAHESGIFAKAERKMSRSKSKTQSSDDASKKKKKSKSKKNQNRISSDKGWEGTVETIKLSDSESEHYNSKKQAEKIIEALQGFEGVLKKKHKKSKSKKYSESSVSSQSAGSKSHSDTSVSSSSSHKSRKSSRKNNNNQYDNDYGNINQNLHQIDQNFAKKLENAPMGLMTVPDHILQQLESNNMNQAVAAMGIPNMQQTEGSFGFDPMMNAQMSMPQMSMPQMQMPQMQMPQMSMPQQLINPMNVMQPLNNPMNQLQPMGLEQMFQGMQGQGSQSGLPMMPMMGGGKKNNEYSFAKNGQAVDQISKDFFF